MEIVTVKMQFRCPKAHQLCNTTGAELSIEGFCADAEHASAHFISVRCPACHEEHKIRI